MNIIQVTADQVNLDEMASFTYINPENPENPVLWMFKSDAARIIDLSNDYDDVKHEPGAAAIFERLIEKYSIHYEIVDSDGIRIQSYPGTQEAIFRALQSVV